MEYGKSTYLLFTIPPTTTLLSLPNISSPLQFTQSLPYLTFSAQASEEFVWLEFRLLIWNHSRHFKNEPRFRLLVKAYSVKGQHSAQLRAPIRQTGIVHGQHTVINWREESLRCELKMRSRRSQRGEWESAVECISSQPMRNWRKKCIQFWLVAEIINTFSLIIRWNNFSP